MPSRRQLSCELTDMRQQNESPSAPPSPTVEHRSAPGTHSKNTADQALSGRRERLTLLHDIRDQDPRLRSAGFATSMRRDGRNLEPIARLQRARRLTFYGELE